MGREKLNAVLGRPYLAVFVAIAVSAVAVLSAYPFSAERLAALTRESGWIEVATAILYFVAVAALLASWRWDGRFMVHSAFIVSLLGARELEAHKAFTTDSVLGTRFYFRDHVELPEKLIAGAVMLVLLVIVLRYLRNWHRLRHGLVLRSPAAISAALAILLLPATKSLDAFGRVAIGLGFEINFDINVVGIVEESVELAIPVVILLAAIQFYIASRRREDIQPRPLTEAGRKNDRPAKIAAQSGR